MHLVESMAYVGPTPWHGLGNELARRQLLEAWAQQTGMHWRIESGDVRYVAQADHLGTIHAFPSSAPPPTTSNHSDNLERLVSHHDTFN